MMPCGTISGHMGPLKSYRPFDGICGHLVPYGTTWCHRVPYGAILSHMGPYGARQVPFTPTWGPQGFNCGQYAFDQNNAITDNSDDCEASYVYTYTYLYIYIHILHVYLYMYIYTQLRTLYVYGFNMAITIS